VLELSNVKVLEHYDSFNPPLGPRWENMKCPFHDDRNASARSNGSGFICMACGVKGGPIQLIMEREDIDYPSAIEFYEGVTGEQCHVLQQAVTYKRRRPFSEDLSESPRDYERNGGLLSLRSGKRSASRKRPRFHGE
jgi:CHC2 zinc finger